MDFLPSMAFVFTGCAGALGILEVALWRDFARIYYGLARFDLPVQGSESILPRSGEIPGILYRFDENSGELRFRTALQFFQRRPHCFGRVRIVDGRVVWVKWGVFPLSSLVMVFLAPMVLLPSLWFFGSDFIWPFMAFAAVLVLVINAVIWWSSRLRAIACWEALVVELSRPTPNEVPP